MTVIRKLLQRFKHQGAHPRVSPSTDWTEEEMERLHNGGLIRVADYGDGIVHRGWVMTRGMNVYGCALGLAEDETVDDLGYVRDVNGKAIGVWI